MSGELSYCETIHASATTPWHLRILTGAGKKLGGGADTKSFCGLEVAWDLDVEISLPHNDRVCQTCVAKAANHLFDEAAKL